MRSPRWKRNRAMKCLCGGYHFPHRAGGGACETSKTRDIHIAKRGGNAAEIMRARMDCAIDNGISSTSTACPF